MDSDELRTILSKSRVDVWSLIDAAIAVAATDYGGDLKDHRDGIVQKLYFPTSSSGCSGQLCRNCHSDVGVGEEDRVSHQQRREENQQRRDQNRDQEKKQVPRRSTSPLTPESNHKTDDINGVENDDDGLGPYGGLLDDEQAKILHIREQLEDPEQVSDFLFIFSVF